MHPLYYLLIAIAGLIGGAIVYGLIYLAYDSLYLFLKKLKSKRDAELIAHLERYREENKNKKEVQNERGTIERTRIFERIKGIASREQDAERPENPKQ